MTGTEWVLLVLIVHVGVTASLLAAMISRLSRDLHRLRADLHETRDALARPVYYWLTSGGDLDEEIKQRRENR